MKKFVSLLLTCLMLLGLALPCFADTTETAEEAARRFLEESAVTMKVQYRISDVSTLTLKAAGNYYEMNGYLDRGDWTLEQMQTAKGLSPLYTEEEGKIFLVYNGEKPVTVIFLQKGDSKWLLRSMNEDSSNYFEAAAYFTEKTGIRKPAVLYAGIEGGYYLFDDQTKNGYVLFCRGEKFYRAQDVLEYQYQEWLEIKDTLDEYGKTSEGSSSYADVLSLRSLTSVEPVKRINFSIWFVIIPVVVLAAAVILILVVRKKKVK